MVPNFRTELLQQQKRQPMNSCLKSITVLSSPVIVLDENKKKRSVNAPGTGWDALEHTCVWTDGSDAVGSTVATPVVKPRPVRVVHSLFPHKRPTIFFDYPAYVGACWQTPRVVTAACWGCTACNVSPV